MPNLTERQRNLLRLLNMLSQNLTEANLTDSGLSNNFSIGLPGFNFESNLNLGSGAGAGDENGDEETPAPPGSEPETILDVLRNLRNEQVELTTPFGTVTGTLIFVGNDFVVLAEADGNRVLVRVYKIELVRDL